VVFRTLRVHSIRLATPRTRIITLDLSGASFPFQAGQAVMVGLHGSLLRKPYSIASAPIEASRSGLVDLLVQIEDSGGLDPHLELADTGSLVDVDGPFGTFGLADHADVDGLLFVAGGTGIAPLRSMLIESLSAQRPPAMALVYSARSREELAYASELQRLANASRLRAYLTVTRNGTASWSGRHGRIDRRLLEEALPSRQALCLLCGPPGLVTSVREWLVELGLPEERILTESFSAH
jgi:ferredoxin-NADP reductase